MRMPEGDRKGRRATALRYEGEGAPRVVASGRGALARRIVELAEEAGVPVKRDAALAESLSRLERDFPGVAEEWVER